MALIIEDGSIVTSANSYVTDAEYISYAALRNKTIGTASTNREHELILAMDYLYSQNYKGVRADPENQEQPFPRQGLTRYGLAYASDSIPKEIKNAQMEAAIASNSQELSINSANNNIASAKLDVMETSYFDGGTKTRIRLDRVQVYLSELLSSSNKLVRT